MTRQRVVLLVVCAFIVAFAFLTLFDAVHNGVSVLTIVSLGVIVLFFVGIVGALTQPPRR